jgi:phage baseplate assembly protein W
MRFSALKASLPAVVSSYVREALERWVPEVTLQDVGVKQDTSIGRLIVRVVYLENDSKKTVAATITTG